MRTSNSKMFLALVTLLATTAGFPRAEAQDAPESWQVAVHFFSGLPNPVFALSAGELADIKSRLGMAKSVVDETNVKTIRPVKLGYRGLTIVGKTSDGKRVTGDVEVYRGKILRRLPGPAAVLDDSAVGIERFLLSLGVAKKAVSSAMMQEIQQLLR